ncbi:pyrimidine-specific ribonucleoside hydrolase [Anaerovirgula multivorans]|uniref:Pyrimidine-specific ribonucleoside hydrolase n=1 Tax=Anaerovirgula multivorans TaxID=312168 RepID=A0A239FB42_9FIRM|nr:nucleoside hydrolase [Anaerovirgula multivorans]SNS54109.1 pyrimidine-specific ribonucleoside hydrolase [Anaerovirgula multivorans]
MKTPVIIDTDPGIDDAVAIFLAFSQEKILDVRGITTIAGNVNVDRTTRNALDLVGHIGKNAKIAKGAPKPLLRSLKTAEEVHGKTGLGPVVLKESKLKFYEKKAWDLIHEEAEAWDGELEIIALGPLTNIAITLIKYPDIKKKIKKVTLMGGACFLGNVTPSAEFNIYVDPEAADIVFQSGIPITMVGLDATHQALLYEEDIENLTSRKNVISETLKIILKENLAFQKKVAGLEAAIMHDAVAVAAVIDPTIIQKKHYYVAVEKEGFFTYGKTVVDLNKVTKNSPNVEVALGVDRLRFIDMLKEMMKTYELL